MLNNWNIYWNLFYPIRYKAEIERQILETIQRAVIDIHSKTINKK